MANNVGVCDMSDISTLPHRVAMEDLKRYADDACQAAEAQSRALLARETALLSTVQDLTAARAADAAGHAVSLQEVSRPHQLSNLPDPLFTTKNAAPCATSLLPFSLAHLSLILTCVRDSLWRCRLGCCAHLFSVQGQDVCRSRLASCFAIKIA